MFKLVICHFESSNPIDPQEGCYDLDIAISTDLTKTMEFRATDAAGKIWENDDYLWSSHLAGISCDGKWFDRDCSMVKWIEKILIAKYDQVFAAFYDEYV